MRESKIRKFKMAMWLPLLVLIIGIAIVAPMSHVSYSRNKEQKENAASLVAESYSERIKSELIKGFAVVQTFEQILISGNGEADKFDLVAQNLITTVPYLQSVWLAPETGTEKMYPADSEKPIALLSETSAFNEASRVSKLTGNVVVQGPLKFSSGNEGLAVRKPVYLFSSSGTPEFWGFAVAIIKVPDVFRSTIDGLHNFGYDYKFTVKSQFEDSEVVAASNLENISEEIPSHSFDLGYCEWRLAVKPTAGWGGVGVAALICAVGVSLSLLFSLLVQMFLMFAEKSKKYKSLATEDALTGLLNRAGFSEESKKYFRENKGEPCVEVVLDVDDFKIVNDLYGHGVGDNTLVHLANDLVGAFSENSIIARNGGDEFGMILKGRTAKDVANDLRKFTMERRSFWLNGKNYSYSLSMGYAEYPSQAKDSIELASKSDIALYEAKLRGKHYCFAYDESVRFEKRVKLGFALHDVSENLPGAFLIYKADINDDTMLFANNEMVRLAGCNDLDDFMDFCGRRFSGLIRPDEVKSVETSIWQQIDEKRDGCNDYVQFHFATKDGSYKPVLDHGRIVESQNYGRVFYVLIIDTGFIKTHYTD